MKNDIERILVSEEELKEINEKLGKAITELYKNSDKKLMLVPILKGSVIFSSDLMRNIDLPVTIDFIRVSSYGAGTVSSGNINLSLDLPYSDLSDYDVLLIEDILDTGRTLYYLKDYLKSRNPASVKICTLLDKPERRIADITPDLYGTVIPDEFVVGYGLDYDEKYRNLPYIGVLKRSVYEK